MRKIYKLPNLKIVIIIILFLLDSFLVISVVYSKKNYSYEFDITSLGNEECNIINEFYKSIKYYPEEDFLSFTIPQTIPEGYKFYLHIAGGLYMGDKENLMSFHAFDEESINYTWEKGQTYTYPLKSEQLAYCLLSFGLLYNNKGVTYDVNISSDGSKTIIGKSLNSRLICRL